MIRPYIVPLLLVLLFLPVLFNLQVELQQKEALLRESDRMAKSLWNEYEQLVHVNSLLRERVVLLHENLTRTSVQAQACLRQTSVKRAPPQVRLSLDDLHFDSDSVTIDVGEAMPGLIAPTGSMEPLLTQDTVVLEVQPRRVSDILPGDIIIYEREGVRIIHRVIETGWDADGWYAVTQGDNNPRPDPGVVRFRQVKGLVVGIIY